MKTKIIWEESDILPGLRAKNIYNNNEIIIGHSYTEDTLDMVYNLIYTKDWYISKDVTEQQIVQILNAGGWVPANEN